MLLISQKNYDTKSSTKKIHNNWGTYQHDRKDGHEAVWIARSEIAGSYEVDEAWIGMKGDGSLVWAYASGCSCWDGRYETKVEKTVKAFTLDHKHTPQERAEKIITFAQKGELQAFGSYNNYA